MPARAYAADNPSSLFSFNSGSFAQLFELFSYSWNMGRYGLFLNILKTAEKIISVSTNLPDDVLYEINLFISVICGLLLPYITCRYTLRSWYSTLLGIITIGIFSAADVYHFCICLLFTITVCKTHRIRSYRGIVVFVGTFTYITFVRLLDILDTIPLRGTANMILLMTSLRFVNLAYKSQKSKIDQEQIKLSKNHGIEILDMIHYVFFFPGLWSGPLISYDQTMVTLKDPDTYKGRILEACIRKFSYAIPHLVLFLIIPFVYPRSVIFEADFSECTLIKRVCIIWIIIFQRRARFVSAWMLSEVGCLAAGVAYSPGAKNNINTAIVKAYDAKKVELYTSIKELVKNWNCTVQAWLVNNIYKKSAGWPQLMRKQLVLMISALWHGLDSGYYVSFLLIGFFQAGQDSLSLHPYKRQYMLHKFLPLIKWLTSLALVQFAATPFVFPHFEEYMYVWKLQGYFGLYVFAVILLINGIHRISPKSVNEKTGSIKTE